MVPRAARAIPPPWVHDRHTRAAAGAAARRVPDCRPHHKCTNCGYELEVGSTKNLPPCPSCHNGQYQTLSGGDSAEDPYPDRD